MVIQFKQCFDQEDGYRFCESSILDNRYKRRPRQSPVLVIADNFSGVRLGATYRTERTLNTPNTSESEKVNNPITY